MLKIVSNVFHSLTNVINCIMYFSLFATSFHFSYLFWYLYLYFYVADVIIKFIAMKKKNMKLSNDSLFSSFFLLTRWHFLIIIDLTLELIFIFTTNLQNAK